MWYTDKSLNRIFSLINQYCSSVIRKENWKSHRTKKRHYHPWKVPHLDGAVLRWRRWRGRGLLSGSSLPCSLHPLLAPGNVQGSTLINIVSVLPYKHCQCSSIQTLLVFIHTNIVSVHPYKHCQCSSIQTLSVFIHTNFVSVHPYKLCQCSSIQTLSVFIHTNIVSVHPYKHCQCSSIQTLSVFIHTNTVSVHPYTYNR